MDVNAIRWILSVLILIAFLDGMIRHWIFFWQAVVKKTATGSAVPFCFIGLIGSLGVATLPVTGAWRFAWIPLLLDWGSLPMHSYMAYKYLFCSKRRT